MGSALEVGMAVGPCVVVIVVLVTSSLPFGSGSLFGPLDSVRGFGETADRALVTNHYACSYATRLGQGTRLTTTRSAAYTTHGAKLGHWDR